MAAAASDAASSSSSLDGVEHRPPVEPDEAGVTRGEEQEDDGGHRESEEHYVRLLPSSTSATSAPPAAAASEHVTQSCTLLTASFILLLAVLALLLPLLLVRYPTVLTTISDAFPPLPSLSPPAPPPSPASLFGPLPSTSSCVVTLYSHDDASRLYELQWAAHYVVSLLPSLCSRRCVLRWRPWHAFEPDFTSHPDNPSGLFQPQPHIAFPIVWVGWRDDLATIQQFCDRGGAVGLAWCRRSVLLLHVGDERRGGGGGRFRYDTFHTAFRSYHSQQLCDLSYLLQHTLLELGYPATALAFDATAAPHNSTGYFAALAQQRIDEYAGKGPGVGDCPPLATRVRWDLAMSGVKEELQAWLSSIAVQQGISERLPLPVNVTDVPADWLHRVHERVRAVASASASAPASDPSSCYSSSLFAYYQREQARLHDGMRTPDGTHVPPLYWMPVGHSMNGMAVMVEGGVMAASLRRLFWSWIGSLKEDAERLNMSRGIHAADLPPSHWAVLQRGLYYETVGFGHGLRGPHYTQTMADSTFVPLPEGDSGDQFRIHEALEAGAIPIVSHRHVDDTEDGSLSYFHHLAMDPVYLDREAGFEGLLDALYALQFVPSDVLDGWQAVVYARYMLMMRSMRAQVAQRICMMVDDT